MSFDDGPYPLTQDFVRMLRANGAVATFFMIGRPGQPELPRDAARRVARRRCARRSHVDAPRPRRPLDSAVRGELASTREVIKRESGYSPCVFRPPYGDYDATVVRVARSLGLATILWDVDPSDYALPGVAAIEQRVLAQATAGSIIISHDGGGPRQRDARGVPADHPPPARAGLSIRDGSAAPRLPNRLPQLLAQLHAGGDQGHASARVDRAGLKSPISGPIRRVFVRKDRYSPVHTGIICKPSATIPRTVGGFQGMTSMNALAVVRSGKTITSTSLGAKRSGRRTPGVVLGLLTAMALLALPAAAGAQTTSTSSLAGYSETPTVSTSSSTHSTVSSSTVTTETASPGVTPASGSKPESKSKPEHTRRRRRRAKSARRARSRRRLGDDREHASVHGPEPRLGDRWGTGADRDRRVAARRAAPPRAPLTKDLRGKRLSRQQNGRRRTGGRFVVCDGPELANRAPPAPRCG